MGIKKVFFYFDDARNQRVVVNVFWLELSDKTSDTNSKTISNGWIMSTNK